MTTEDFRPGERLFETGCALCGGTNSLGMVATDGIPPRANPGAMVCRACRDPHDTSGDFNGFAWADGEITRRKPLPPQHEPKVGDLCEGRNRLTGDVFTGKLLGFVDRGKQAEIEDKAMPRMPWIVDTASLRLVPPAATEFYGEQPDPLPETLPAGTRSTAECVALTIIRLEVREGCHGYWGRWRYKGGQKPERDQYTAPVHIDWASTPRPSKQPVPAPLFGLEPTKETERLSGMKPPPPGLPDPFASYDLNAWGIVGGSEREKRLERVREILTCRHEGNATTGFCRLCGASATELIEMTKRREAAGAFPHIDQRIAATRISREREVSEGEGRSSHPKNWPSGSGEELFATSGWSGR